VGAARFVKVRYTPSANTELGAVLEYIANRCAPQRSRPFVYAGFHAVMIYGYGRVSTDAQDLSRFGP
jgi:hypothetical protein